jgi:NAD(P)-dependent dehydrogenase (short-subunit alcohol dehydrogenase family)
MRSPNARGHEAAYSPVSLSGRVAVVLGGTSGIGRAIALALAEAGADVVASARRANLVESVAGEIEDRGRRTLRMSADVSSRASLVALRDACLARLGRLDILVSAAAVTKRLPSMDMPDADWRRIIDTNLTGTLHACQVFGAPMLEQRAGRIITIASLASMVGFFEVAAYTASKAAVAGLTRALAVEWAPKGVTVNAVAPGIIRTDLNRALIDSPRGHELLLRTPMKRFGEPDDVAGAAVFLASDAARFITGQMIVVDGGFLASGVNQ